MKFKILFLIGILITTFACSNDNDHNSEVFDLDGQYIGTFERNDVISNVEIGLNDGNFSGQSDKTNFPAIYFGNFSKKGNSINFNNKQLIITNEFDPNLILDGNWNYEMKNNTLIMSNSLGDIYILMKN